jgi:hypothetical protein
MNINDLSGDALIAMYLDAKAKEAEFAEVKRAAAAQMAVLFGTTEEGTITANTDRYKVAIRYSVTRKVDVEALQTNWAKLPPEVQAAFKWKADVNTKEYRAALLDSKTKAMVTEFVTSKPASPSIEIEAKDGN